MSRISEIFTDRSGNFKLAILRHPLYYWGLLFKVLLSALFAGRLMTTYFIPFVQYYWNSGFSNPYSHFIEVGHPEAFPYPAVMLYFLTFTGGIWADLSPLFLRVPLLLMDTVVLVLLSRLTGQRDKKLLMFYWWSPVLIYISYIHGQFDVIPIAFLIAAMYFLVKKRYIFSAMTLAFGVLTKTNLILAIPFFFLYIWKNEYPQRVGKIGKAALIFVGVTVLLSIPYLFSGNYLEMVYHNQEQVKVWIARLTTINNLEFYLIPAVYLVLLAAASRVQKFSQDLFILLVGFSFAMLLLFIPPQPGWYFWILPFLIYFNVKERKLTFLPILALQVAFLLFFAISPNSDYSFVFLWKERSVSVYQFLIRKNLNADLLVSLAFTLLQTVLILNVYWIFKAGVQKNLNSRLKTKPYMIGIGGDSGVGKSTLTNLLCKLFGQEQVTVIRGDDMHRWERGHEKWNELTHLSPKANHLHQDIKHLKALRTGKPVDRRNYDHNTGMFTEPARVYPGKLVVFEGLHPFYIAAKRNLFHLKVFVEPKEELRLYWKIKRDMNKRGYTRDRVLQQLELREPDSEKYIRSQAPFSDIRVQFYAISEIPDCESDGQPKLGLKIELETNIDINPLVELVGTDSSLNLEHEYEIDHQTLLVRGDLDRRTVERLVQELPLDTNEFFENATYENGLNGFLQLFFIYCILTKIENE